MAKIFGQLEKAQLENVTSDTGSLPKGFITYRTDLNIAKVSNGTSMLALIDESSTQTLSGKTYASPVFTGAITAAQISTPSNPSAGNQKLYFKSDGKLYSLDSAGNEAQIGSGGTGGVKNLITNGNADDTAASIFVPYADAAGTRPVDGTGGSPTVTTSVTSSTPLDGVKSFLLTKPASNVQGQGWAVSFTVDPAYRAKSLKISADYIVNSGTFVAGATGVESDIIWYLYDVTNSQLIEPSNIKMFSNSSSIADKFEATFQSSVSGSSYRLIAHVQSTSALAYEIKLDNITVSPQVYVFGTPVTDWKSFTPTVSGLGSGSLATNTGFYRRVGDSYEIEIKAVKDGTAGTGTANISFSLPNSASIDTTKTSSHISSNLGSAEYYSTNFSAHDNVSWESDVTTVKLGKAGGGFFWRGQDFAANATLSLKFTVPIVGLSSSVQMSDSADTRVLALKYNSGGAQQNISNSTTTTVTTNANKDFDTHAAFNTSTGIFTAPVEGYYEMHAGFQFGTNSSGVRLLYFTPSGGQQILGDYQVGNASIPVQLQGSGLFYLRAGQTLKAEVFQSSGGVLANTTDATGTYIHICKVNGPSAIAANEVVYLEVENTAGTSIANITETEIPFATKYFDSHNGFSSTRFTAPANGFYAIDTVISLAHAGSSERLIRINRQLAGGGGVRIIAQNGGADSELVTNRSGRGMSGKTYLNQGDQIYITLFHTAGSSQSLSASQGVNKLMIARIG